MPFVHGQKTGHLASRGQWSQIWDAPENPGQLATLKTDHTDLTCCVTECIRTLSIHWPTDAVNIRHIWRQTFATFVGPLHTVSVLSLPTCLKAFNILGIITHRTCRQQTRCSAWMHQLMLLMTNWSINLGCCFRKVTRGNCRNIETSNNSHAKDSKNVWCS